jgi:hypothetical protein
MSSELTVYRCPEDVAAEADPGEYDGLLAGRPTRELAKRRFVVGRQAHVYYGYAAPLIAKTRLFSDTSELLEFEGDVPLLTHIDMETNEERRAFELVWMIVNGVNAEPFWNEALPLDVLTRMWIYWAYFGVIQYMCLDQLLGVMGQRVDELGTDEPFIVAALPASFREMLTRFRPQDPTDKQSREHQAAAWNTRFFTLVAAATQQ